jgi:anti-anti-sigma factor
MTNPTRPEGSEPDSPSTSPRPASSSGLDVNIIDLGKSVVVRLDGKADMLTVDRMQFALVRLIARRVPLAVLDLSGLIFLASLAMGVLVTFRRDIHRFGGCVRLAGVRPEIHECLQVAGLADLFEFCASVEEATAAVG